MLFRCESCGPPQNRAYIYVASVEPIGYAGNTAAVCGTEDCENEALVYLDRSQYWHYQYDGERVFNLHNRADASVRVKDQSDSIIEGRKDQVLAEDDDPEVYELDDKSEDKPRTKNAATW